MQLTYINLQTYIYSYIHTYIHTYIHISCIHTYIHTTYIQHTYTYIHAGTYTVAYTPAFVGRFTAEALPHYMYKHIEEDLQEWERNLCKVNGSSVRKECTVFLWLATIYFAACFVRLLFKAATIWGQRIFLLKAWRHQWQIRYVWAKRWRLLDAVSSMHSL